VVIWFAYVTYYGNKQDASERWLRLDDSSLPNLQFLAKNNPDTPAGKSARLQLAWFAYWELGVKRLGAEPADAMEKLNIASSNYKQLIDDSGDDATFGPQAYLGYAVVEETKGIHDPSFLDKAAEAYKAVVDKHKDTQEAKFAQERLDQLKDKKQRTEIIGVYDELRKGLGVRVMPNVGGFGQPIPGLPPLPDEKKK
jgi:hypothetical protein